MKKLIFSILLFALVLGLSGCAQNKDLTIVNTYEQTPSDLIEEYTDNEEEVTWITYYEMSDGTWKTDEHTYRYRLILTGRLNHAVCDTTYTILSNTENITFDQAWKASGLSSNLDDYFKTEDAVIVAVKWKTQEVSSARAREIAVKIVSDLEN